MDYPQICTWRTSIHPWIAHEIHGLSREVRIHGLCSAICGLRKSIPCTNPYLVPNIYYCLVLFFTNSLRLFLLSFALTPIASSSPSTHLSFLLLTYYAPLLPPSLSISLLPSLSLSILPPLLLSLPPSIPSSLPLSLPPLPPSLPLSPLSGLLWYSRYP